MKPASFFVDDAGECSCMRLLAVLVVLFVLLMWGIGIILAGTYLPLGYGEAGIISSAIAGKVVQARYEYGLPGNYPIPRAGAASGESVAAPAPRDLGTEGGRDG